MADELGLRFLETSAKSNINVEEAFFALATCVFLPPSPCPPFHASRSACTGGLHVGRCSYAMPYCAETSRTGWPKPMRRAEVRPVRRARRAPTRSDSAGPATPRTRAAAASRGGLLVSALLVSFLWVPAHLSLSASHPLSLVSPSPLVSFPYRFLPRSHTLALPLSASFLRLAPFFSALCICHDFQFFSRPSLFSFRRRPTGLVCAESGCDILQYGFLCESRGRRRAPCT